MCDLAQVHFGIPTSYLFSWTLILPFAFVVNLLVGLMTTK